MPLARQTYASTAPPTPPVLTTATPLGGAGAFNTGVITTGGAGSLTGTVFADQTGTIFIEQSFDQINWDVSTSYSVTANDGKGFKEVVVADYAQVRYVNGATPQTAFRLTVVLR